MVIGAVEDQIIARLVTAFQGRLREIDHKPAKLDADELMRMLTVAPAAYVSFLGWTGTERPDQAVKASWGVYLIASNAGGEQARRRGDDATIGAYEMLEVAVAYLDDWTPASAAGFIDVRSAENLFGTAFEKAGRSVYALVVDVPLDLNPVAPDTAPSLDAFVTFHADWDVPGFGNVATPPPAPDTGATRADAVDRVTLPQ
jgi:phage gp37-like protein